MCAWQSTRPGSTYIPAPSISFTPFSGRFDSLMAVLGKPTLLISLIRLFSMTMSTGPIGGAPAPSIIVAPRMTSRSNGPSPSPGLRSGAGGAVRCARCVCANTTATPKANNRTTNHDLYAKRDIAVLLLKGWYSAARKQAADRRNRRLLTRAALYRYQNVASSDLTARMAGKG